jgi:DNA repair exonuclease SbcCD ATPase subunit
MPIAVNPAQIEGKIRELEVRVANFDHHIHSLRHLGYPTNHPDIIQLTQGRVATTHHLANEREQLNHVLRAQSHLMQTHQPANIQNSHLTHQDYQKKLWEHAAAVETANDRVKAHREEIEKHKTHIAGLESGHAHIQSSLVDIHKHLKTTEDALGQVKEKYELSLAEVKRTHDTMKTLHKIIGLPTGASERDLVNRLHELRDNHHNYKNFYEKVKHLMPPGWKDPITYDNIYMLIDYYKKQNEAMHTEITSLRAHIVEVKNYHDTHQAIVHSKEAELLEIENARDALKQQVTGHEQQIEEMENEKRAHKNLHAQATRVRSHAEKPQLNSPHVRGGLKSLYKAARQGWGDWAAGTHRW